MFKIFKTINVFGLVKKVVKYGEYIKLISDTAAFFHSEAEARGLVIITAPVEVVKNAAE